MLQLFRRFTKSRVGVLVTFAVLGLIALAFAAGDVTGLAPSGGAGGGAVARVGGKAIGAAEFEQRVRNELEGIRRQSPGIDMAAFVSEGGFDAVLERMINGLALEAFGEELGMVVGKRQVDGQLASIPALQDATGKFSQQVYENLLRQNRLTDAGIRADIARDTMAQLLVVPTVGASQVPQQLALPYAALLLERRQGTVATIPASAVPQGAPPTDAELQTWYRRNLARYTVPERRVIRYARVSPDQVRAASQPSDAEIAQAYAANRARFAASEKRDVAQVVVLQQAAANALAARVRAGTPLADAARAAGLEPTTLAGTTKADYARATSAAVADAVFAAPRGSVVGPVRGALGFVVARVDAITAVPARTLAEARAELSAELATQKTQDALTRIQNALGDGASDGSTFAELVADQKLAAQVTPALLATGLNPDQPGALPDPALAPIVQAGFAAQDGDDPVLVPLGQDGGFALVALDRVVAAAPRPLAQVREAVERDFRADRAQAAARQVATRVLAAVNRGTPLAEALRASGLSLPPTRPLAAARAELAQNPRGAPPTLALLFSMAQGTTKLLAAPDGAGWLLVRLDRIEPADPRRNPAVVAATRADLGQAIGREYVLQLTAAARNAVGVERNADAIAKVRATLLGQGGGNPN